MATILVVDDDVAILDLLVDLFSDSGHTILAASNGREALQLAQTYGPRLIITDITMPYLDGYGLVRALRDNPILAHTMIILMSASFNKHPPPLSDTIPPFIPKPLDLDLLERIVQRLP